MKCPTRRSGSAIVAGTDQTGPLGDYALVIYVRDAAIAAGKTTSANAPTNYWYYPSDRARFNSQPANVFCSPWMLAIIEGSDRNRWFSANSFASWFDGTANQIIIDEKHIPSNALGQCYLGSGTTGKVFIADCSYLNTDWNRWGSMQRVVKKYADLPNLLTNSPKDKSQGTTNPDCRPNDGYGFGSYHTGTCNFLFGDGSVYGFPTTVSDDVMFMLSDVQDGGAVALP